MIRVTIKTCGATVTVDGETDLREWAEARGV